MAARLRRPQLAARAPRAGVCAGSRAEGHPRLRGGLGRRPLDRARGDRGRRPGACDRPRSLRPLLLAPGRVVCGQGQCGPAQPVRRPRGQEHRKRMTELAENPLLEGLRARRAPDPCALTIFGASGDLTKRKLFPALYALAYRNLLPEQFGVVGVARTDMTTEEFRDRMREAVVEHGRDEFREDIWDELAEGVR